MRAADALQAMHFAAGISKLKQAADSGNGVMLTPEDVTGLIWGIKLLRGGSKDAAAADPA